MSELVDPSAGHPTGECKPRDSFLMEDKYHFSMAVVVHMLICVVELHKVTNLPTKEVEDIDSLLAGSGNQHKAPSS